LLLEEAPVWGGFEIAVKAGLDPLATVFDPVVVDGYFGFNVPLDARVTDHAQRTVYPLS
jgi:hypothetical protein